MHKLFFSFLSFVIVAPVFAQALPQSSPRTVRENTRQGITTAKNIFHEEAQRRQEEFKTMMEGQREALKKQIEKKRTELRQRLQTIRDEQKRKAVEKIDAHMDALNERWTGNFSHVVEQLENILGKITERAAQEGKKGRAVVAVDTALSGAKDSIATSRSAIVAQTGKTYAMSISTEEGLRTDVGKTRKVLHDDLVAVRETVKNARDAVHNAALALAKVLKDAEEKQATTSSSTIHNTP